MYRLRYCESSPVLDTFTLGKSAPPRWAQPFIYNCKKSGLEYIGPEGEILGYGDKLMLHQDNSISLYEGGVV